MSTVSITSRSDLSLPLTHNTQLNVPSSPSPVNRTVSTIMFSRAKRIKLAKRVRQTQLVNMINQINHIKKINKINKINKTDKTKKIKNIKKVESYRMTSKPVFVLPSVKLFRSSSRAAWASPTTKSSLGKRIRHHSADPSIKLCDEPARSNKKPKQWAENSLDLEGSPSVPAQRPQSVNIPSWIEARRNEHQEQVAPYPWGGSILRSRSPLHQFILCTESSISSFLSPTQLPLISSDEQLEVSPPIVHKVSAEATEINLNTLEESRREQQFFRVSVLLSVISLFLLFLLL